MPWRRKDAERSASPFSLAALAEAFTYQGLTYGLPGLQPTLPGQRQEAIGSQYRSLAAGAFKSNAVVFACMATRMRLFSEARFQFQQLRVGGPGKLFGKPELALLETPWTGGTTGDLLARMIQHADLAGNAFVARRPDSLSCLRPDWVTLIVGSLTDAAAGAWGVDSQVIGYLYKEGGEGSGIPAEIFDASEVAHFAPIPDPEARFRGMSWLTPLVREVMADKAMTDHELAFFEGGASPSRVVKLDITDLEKFKAWVAIFEENHGSGVANAYKDIFLGAGADVTVVGTNLQQLEFSTTRGHGETRIAAAAGVPPIIVGLSEGLAAATYSNYGQARRALADGTLWPLWRNAAGSLARIVDVPAGARLWIDASGIAFLREDESDAADIQSTKALTIKALVDAGFDSQSVIDAVVADDFTRLSHSGLFSVQLQAAGQTNTQTQGASETVPPANNGRRAAALITEG